MTDTAHARDGGREAATRLSDHLFRAAVIYALLGMALGLQMAASHDHSQMPTHAHLLLFGWVSMALYAAFYRLVPAAATRLATVHAALAHIGLIGLTVGLYLVYAGNVPVGEPVATGFSLLLFANMALFAWIVFRATRGTA